MSVMPGHHPVMCNPEFWKTLGDDGKDSCRRNGWNMVIEFPNLSMVSMVSSLEVLMILLFRTFQPWTTCQRIRLVLRRHQSLMPKALRRFVGCNSLFCFWKNHLKMIVLLKAWIPMCNISGECPEYSWLMLRQTKVETAILLPSRNKKQFWFSGAHFFGLISEAKET